MPTHIKHNIECCIKITCIFVSLCSDTETKDEPYAWEAREFLRKKLVGKEVAFSSEKPANSATREYGFVWTGKDIHKDENLTELLLAEGLVKVRDGGRNIPQLKRLVDIEDAAKSAGKGIWGADANVSILLLQTFENITFSFPIN